jgi:hypothetical protein
MLCSWILRKPLASGLLYKLSELEFLTGLIKLIASFLGDTKFRFLVEGDFSTPREIATGLPQGFVLAPILYRLHINDAPADPGTHLALFRGRYFYLCDRETRTSCSLQTATRTHCIDFMM